MKTTLTIQEATQEYRRQILTLLHDHHLSTKDVIESEIIFFIGLKDEDLIACAGIENYGKEGLLRSVAVQKELTGKGIGSDLIDLVLNKIKAFGIEEVYLLTETAEQFFSCKGFSNVNRKNAPASIKNSSEFTEVCSSSAVLMMKKLL